VGPRTSGNRGDGSMKSSYVTFTWSTIVFIPSSPKMSGREPKVLLLGAKGRGVEGLPEGGGEYTDDISRATGTYLAREGRD
jgi:hypothetical protein